MQIDTFTYQQLNVSFYCNTSAPDSNNTFELTFDGEQAQGQTFFFSLFSLFPETFKGTHSAPRQGPPTVRVVKLIFQDEPMG